MLSGSLKTEHAGVPFKMKFDLGEVKSDLAKLAARCALLGAILAGSHFAICLVVHLSTYFGGRPYETIPNLWMIHSLLGASVICLVVEGQVLDPKNKSEGLNHSPSWAYVLIFVMWFYGFFTMFLAASYTEGGSPERRGEKLLLVVKGDIVRELSNQEFLLLQSLEDRSFSSWCLGVSAFLLAFNLSAYQLARRGTSDSSVEETPPQEPEMKSPSEEISVEADRSRPFSNLELLLLFVLYPVCIACILTELPVLNFAASIPIGIACVIGIIRRNRFHFEYNSWEMFWCGIAFLVNVGCGFLLSRGLAEFVYLFFFVSPQSAVTNSVWFLEMTHHRYPLSNGELADGRVMTALALTSLPVILCSILGLTLLSEILRRSAEDFIMGVQGIRVSTLQLNQRTYRRMAFLCYAVVVLFAYSDSVVACAIAGTFSILIALVNLWVHRTAEESLDVKDRAGCIARLVNFTISLRLIVNFIGLILIIWQEGIEQGLKLAMTFKGKVFWDHIQVDERLKDFGFPFPLYTTLTIVFAFVCCAGLNRLTEKMLVSWRSAFSKINTDPPRDDRDRPLPPPWLPGSGP